MILRIVLSVFALVYAFKIVYEFSLKNNKANALLDLGQMFFVVYGIFVYHPFHWGIALGAFIQAIPFLTSDFELPKWQIRSNESKEREEVTPEDLENKNLDVFQLEELDQWCVYDKARRITGVGATLREARSDLQLQREERTQKIKNNYLNNNVSS